MREPAATRRGADPRSVIREWRAFRRATAHEPYLPAGALGHRPLVVLTCAPGEPTVSERVYWSWRDLHEDLARLSINSRHAVSQSPSHYLMAGDPELVTTAIREVVHCARSGEKLSELPAARADGN